MNPTEAGQLLAHAAAFDNHKPSAAAALAWAAALKDMPCDQDAIEAIARYYGQAGDDPGERRWLQPHHVRHHRQQIRNERITAAKPLYDGHPDETPEQSVANLRRLITAAGDGQLPARPVRAMIEAAQQPAIGTRARAAIETAAGSVRPPARPGVVNVLGVPCSICCAAVGKPCQSRRRRSRPDAHPARLEDARRAAAGLPPVDRAKVEAELERRRQAAATALSLVADTGEDGAA